MPSKTVANPDPRQLDDVDQEFVSVFDALSEPVRLQIVRAMVVHADDEYPCTALDEELPISKSTISYHVKILRGAGLISVRKVGRNYFYRLRTEKLESFAPALLAHLRGE